MVYGAQPTSVQTESNGFSLNPRVAQRVFTNGEWHNPEGIGYREVALQTLQLVSGSKVTLIIDPNDQRLYLKFGLRESNQANNRSLGVTYYRLSTEQRNMPPEVKAIFAQRIMADDKRLISTPRPSIQSTGRPQWNSPGVKAVVIRNITFGSEVHYPILKSAKTGSLFIGFQYYESSKVAGPVKWAFYELNPEQANFSEVQLKQLISGLNGEDKNLRWFRQAQAINGVWSPSVGVRSESWFDSGVFLTVSHKQGASRVKIYKRTDGNLTYWGVNSPGNRSNVQIFASTTTSLTSAIRDSVNAQIVDLYKNYYGATAKPSTSAPTQTRPTGDNLLNNAVTRFVSNFFGDVAKSLSTHFDALKDALNRGDWASVHTKSVSIMREIANSPLYLVQQGVRTINGLIWPDQSESIRTRISKELSSQGDTVRFGCAAQFDFSTNLRRAAKQSAGKMASALVSGEFGLGAGIRTSAEISVVRVKGGSYSINVELKDVGGATASANAKAPFFKSNESDNLSASAGAFAGLGNLSRGRYQCDSAEDAIRVTQLLHQFIKNRDSLSAGDWRFLASKRVAHSQGGYYSVSASASLQIGFSLWPRGADANAAPAVKPGIMKFQIAGGVQLSIQGGYDAIFIDSANGQPPKVRLRNEMQFQGSDFSAGIVNPRAPGNSNPDDGGLPKQPRTNVKVSGGGRTEFGSRLVVFETEYSLTATEARYFRSLGGKIPIEEMSALQSRRAAEGTSPNFARVRISNIRRQAASPSGNAFERGTITVTLPKPTYAELIDLQSASVVGLTQGTKAMQELKSKGALPQRTEVQRVRELLDRANPADIFIQGSIGVADVNGWGLTSVLRNSTDKIVKRDTY